jgi:hypothetical protein
LIRVWWWWSRVLFGCSSRHGDVGFVRWVVNRKDERKRVWMSREWNENDERVVEVFAWKMGYPWYREGRPLSISCDDCIWIACTNKRRERQVSIARLNGISCYWSSRRQIPSLPLNISNLLASKAFVNMSASWFLWLHALRSQHSLPLNP